MTSKPMTDMPGVAPEHGDVRSSLKGSSRLRARLENRPEIRKPYILSSEEQHKLLEALATDWKPIVLFMLNTGCREKEACELQWAWERKVPSLNASLFIIPNQGGSTRLVILNDEAQAIIEQQRDLHPTHVFTHNGHPRTRINPFVWKRARQTVGLPQMRVYDLRLTFNRRLEEAGVGFKERQDLLGHQKTPDYSHDQLRCWIQATNKACQRLQAGDSR